MFQFLDSWISERAVFNNWSIRPKSRVIPVSSNFIQAYFYESLKKEKEREATFTWKSSKIYGEYSFFKIELINIQSKNTNCKI